MFSNLELINKDFKWLRKQTKKFKLEPEDVLIATINEKGDFYCQAKEGKS